MGGKAAAPAVGLFEIHHTIGRLPNLQEGVRRFPGEDATLGKKRIHLDVGTYVRLEIIDRDGLLMKPEPPHRIPKPLEADTVEAPMIPDRYVLNAGWGRPNVGDLQIQRYPRPVDSEIIALLSGQEGATERRSLYKGNLELRLSAQGGKDAADPAIKGRHGKQNDS